MELIDKAAIIAEIKKHQAIWDGMDSDYSKGQRLAYSDVLSFINTLEVKEVDLDEIANHEDIKNAFKAGYELGMSVSNKAQKGE